MKNFHPTKYILFSKAKLVFVCLLLTPSLCYSQGNILTVLSGDNRIYQGFYSQLETALDENHTLNQIQSLNINDEDLEQYDLIISVGSRAAMAIAKYEVKQTIIHTLIPENESLLAKAPCKKTNCFRVYINQPAIRYIKLFKSLFSKRNRLVLATTRANTKLSQQLKIAAAKNEIFYKNIYINSNDNVARSLISQLNNNDVLLALPNPAIYNSSHSRNIILSTYHKNIPIIAYSKAFSKAGALISLYSGIDDIAEKTAKLVDTIYNNGLPKQTTYYPDSFSIEINSAVARSLNISIDTKNAVMRSIK